MRRTLLWLFAVALLIRVVLSVVRVIYGFPDEISLGAGWINKIPLYRDFILVYVNQLSHLAQGYFPYKDFPYNFTPSFLYVLYPFYKIGGSDAASIPIILSDAFTAPVIYSIARIYATNRIACAASLAYALSPLVLIDEGFLWLSSQPVTLFIVLSVYLVKSKKLGLSSVSLAVATLFKQEAALILPLFALWCLRGYKKEGVKALLVTFGIIALVIVPFLFVSYRGFVGQVSYGVVDLGWVPTLQLAHANSTMGGSISAAGQTSSPVVNCLSRSSNATGDSMICSSGVTSYVLFVPYWHFQPYWPFPPFYVWQSSLVLSMILAIAMIPLLFVWRKEEYALEISFAYAMTIFLILFSLVVHHNVRYYWIPVYALLLAASRNRPALLIGSLMPIVSLLTTELLTPEMPPLVAMFWIIVVQVISHDLQLKGRGTDRIGVIS